MKAGRRWSSWKASAALLFLLPLLPHVAGCAKDRKSIEQSLIAEKLTQRHAGVDEHYRVHCPDVLDLAVAGRPELTGRYAIGADGRVNLGDYGNPRVEGRTPVEAAACVAQEIGAKPQQVTVRVAEYRGQHLLLFGEVIGQQRSVPYQGQETVLELLRRVGGITAGAEPTDVYVVRPHLGANRRAEVIHVDLQAIVLKGDMRTNVRLMPYDQIYVGETRRAQVEKAIPPILRGVYRSFAGPKEGATQSELKAK